MSGDRRLQVQRRIPASPEQIFSLLSDPARHTELDGAGMLRGLESGAIVTGTGQAFVMNMNQDGLGDYQMRSEVVVFERNRHIAWAPAIHPPGALEHVIGPLDPSGHRFEWRLEPTPDGHTLVTHIYDWSGVTDADALPLYPRVSEEQLADTLDNLETATRSAT
ncbi:SRPBCC family protein [Pseudonocardia spinosispora]|uniref:SRPBCC family protein n=1 Tax=Pseudonocardia spinosispora TaxID=103441 RepID=UPI0003F592EB|nr:SRPBCC family protein [Pseudonocardia spinosispora]